MATQDASPPTFEDGYQWLSDRAAAAVERLQSIQVADTSPLIDDDKYLAPIYRNYQQNVVQCILSALDHLRFLAWSLKTHETPFPFAQATLIRTATTGAATALWMAAHPRCETAGPEYSNSASMT
jgi:hypothetical protein